MTTIYVTIGNSDDNLPQEAWSKFFKMTDRYVRRYSDEVYGAWVSEATSQYQNACWGFSIESENSIQKLKEELAWVAAIYDQDSIAWSQIDCTEMITAGEERY